MCDYCFWLYRITYSNKLLPRTLRERIAKVSWILFWNLIGCIDFDLGGHNLAPEIKSKLQFNFEIQWEVTYRRGDSNFIIEKATKKVNGGEGLGPDIVRVTFPSYSKYSFEQAIILNKPGTRYWYIINIALN